MWKHRYTSWYFVQNFPFHFLLILLSYSWFWLCWGFTSLQWYFCHIATWRQEITNLCNWSGEAGNRTPDHLLRKQRAYYNHLVTAAPLSYNHRHGFSEIVSRVLSVDVRQYWYKVAFRNDKLKWTPTISSNGLTCHNYTDIVGIYYRRFWGIHK